MKVSCSVCLFVPIGQTNCVLNYLDLVYQMCTPTHPHIHTQTPIGCSAGVGRTGTFIAIDIALQQAEGEGTVDIPSIITKIRNQRMKMVQTVVC